MTNTLGHKIKDIQVWLILKGKLNHKLNANSVLFSTKEF